MRKKIFFGLSLLLVMVVIAGCTTGFNSAGENDGYGELVMNIADSAVNDIAHVWVYIDEVKVHQVDEGWITLNDFADEENERLEVDLLDLRFTEELLGQETMPAGNYDKIRLKLAAASEGETVSSDIQTLSRIVYEEDEDGNKIKEDQPLKVPAGVQKGFQIEYEFLLEADSIVELVLDVDLSKLVYAGNSGKALLNTQVINVAESSISGNIFGQVKLESDTDEPVSIDNLTAGDVFIEAYKQEDYNSDTGEITADEPVARNIALGESDGEREVGEFILRGLPDGEYYLKSYVGTMDSEGNLDIDDTNYQPYTSAETFSVEGGEDTELENPIILSKTQADQ